MAISAIGIISSIFIESSKDLAQKIKEAENYSQQAQELQKVKEFEKANTEEERALKIYEEIINYKSFWTKKEKINPNIDEMLLERKANCLKQLNKFEEAKKIYEELLFISSDREVKSRAFYQIGECYFKQDKFKEAIEQYQIIVDKYSGTTYIKNAYFGLGWAYLKLNEFEEAEKNFRKLESNFPQSELADDARFYILLSLFNLKKFEKVIEEYLPFKENVDYATKEYIDDATFLLADSYFSLNNWEKALEIYTEAKHRFKGEEIESKALVGMADCQIELKKYSQALDLYNQVEKISLTKIMDEVYFGQGRVYYYLEEYENSVKKYSLIIEKYPQSRLINETYYYLGLSYMKLMAKERKYIFSAIHSFKQINKANNIYYQGRLKLAKTYQEINIEEAIKENEIIIAEAPYEIKAQAQYNIGETYFNYQDFPKAILAFKKVIEEYPQTKEKELAELQIGMCYYQLEDFSRSYNDFSSLITNAKQKEIKEQAKFNLGLCLIKLKEYQKAQAIYEELIKKETKLSKLALLQKIIILEEINLNEAIKEYQKIINSLSDEIKLQAQFRLGMIFFKQKEYKKAIEIYFDFYEKASSHSLSSKVLYQLGLSYYYLKDYNNASVYFKKILYQFPNQDLVGQTMYGLVMILKELKVENIISKLEELELEGEACACKLLEIGNLYQAKKEFTKAMQIYEEALVKAIIPENKAIIIYNIGLVLKATQQYNEAIEKFKLIEKMYFFSSVKESAEFEIGECLKEKNDINSALKIFERIITKGGKFKDSSLFNRGLLYCDAEKYEEAIDTFRQIVNSSAFIELKKQAQFMIGNTYYTAGVYEKSIEEFLKVITYKDKNIREKSYYFIAEAYYNLSEFEKAIIFYQKIIDEFSQSEQIIEVYMSLAACFVKIDDFNTAIKKYEIVVNKNVPQRKEAKLNIGNIYYTLSEFELAKKTYLEIIKEFPESSEAKEAFQGIKDIHEKLATILLTKGERLYKLGTTFEKEEDNIRIYNKAIKVFKKVISVYKDTIAAVNAFALLGACLENMDKTVEAYQIYTQFIKTYEGKEEVSSLLGYIKRRIKDLEPKIRLMGKK